MKNSLFVVSRVATWWSNDLLFEDYTLLSRWELPLIPIVTILIKVIIINFFLIVALLVEALLILSDRSRRYISFLIILVLILLRKSHWRLGVLLEPEVLVEVGWDLKLPVCWDHVFLRLSVASGGLRAEVLLIHESSLCLVIHIELISRGVIISSVVDEGRV